MCSSDFINSAILNRVFPDELELTNNTIPSKNKSDSNNKTNNQPISISPLLSNIYEKHINN